MHGHVVSYIVTLKLVNFQNVFYFNFLLLQMGIGERVVIYIYSCVYDWLVSLLSESGQGRVQVEREKLPHSCRLAIAVFCAWHFVSFYSRHFILGCYENHPLSLEFLPISAVRPSPVRQAPKA